jgi:hypothetical protein
MKKSFLILGLGLAVVLFSCKKKTVAESDFKATDMTGSATLKGTITKTMATGGNSPAVGVTVSVKVNNAALYPNSPTAAGSVVSSAVTDANGMYSINVKTLGGGGVPALVTINQIDGTFDPVTGGQATFAGTSTTMNMISGVTKNFDFVMTGTSNGNTITTGTATIMGKLQYQYYKESPLGVYTLTSYTLANHTVMLDFDRDPTSQVVKTYSATTDASGNFSFTVNTTAAAGYNNTGKLYVVDYPTTQDTLKMSGTTVTGKPGYFSNNSSLSSGWIPGGPINPTEIRNGIVLNFGGFIPN